MLSFALIKRFYLYIMCICFQLRNFTIEGKNPAFTVAYMVSDLTDVSVLMVL